MSIVVCNCIYECNSYYYSSFTRTRHLYDVSYHLFYAVKYMQTLLHNITYYKECICGVKLNVAL